MAYCGNSFRKEQTWVNPRPREILGWQSPLEYLPRVAPSTVNSAADKTAHFPASADIFHFLGWWSVESLWGSGLGALISAMRSSFSTSIWIMVPGLPHSDGCGSESRMSSPVAGSRSTLRAVRIRQCCGGVRSGSSNIARGSRFEIELPALHGGRPRRELRLSRPSPPYACGVS